VAADPVIVAETLKEAKQRPARQPISTRLADVAPEQVAWLWPGYIPLGKLTVLDGDPGNGKSTLTTDLAARVTNGAPMPDGCKSDLDGPANVILVSAEDGPGDTIRPRADAAGADVRRVHLLTDVESRDDADRPIRRLWTMPQDLDVLRVLIDQTGSRLVVLDPLSAVLSGSVDSYRDQDVRGALRPLHDVADATGAAILIVRHLTKSGGANALYRGGGSIGIIGAARAGLIVAKDPDDEDGPTRILAPNKNNLAPMAASLRYELEDAPEFGCARVHWLGPTTHSANSLLAEPTSEDERSERDEIADMLKEATAGEPLAVDEFRRLLAKAGYHPSASTLSRARRRAGVTTTGPLQFGGTRFYVRAEEEATTVAPSPVTQSNHAPGDRTVTGLAELVECHESSPIPSGPVTSQMVTGLHDDDDSRDAPSDPRAEPEPGCALPTDPRLAAICRRLAALPETATALRSVRKMGYFERSLEDLEPAELTRVELLLDMQDRVQQKLA